MPAPWLDATKPLEARIDALRRHLLRSVLALAITTGISFLFAHQLIELLTEGTVRLSAVIRSQPPDKAAALITAVDRAIERYRDGDVFKIPAVAVLAVGVKEQPSRFVRPETEPPRLAS